MVWCLRGALGQSILIPSGLGNSRATCARVHMALSIELIRSCVDPHLEWPPRIFCSGQDLGIFAGERWEARL